MYFTNHVRPSISEYQLGFLKGKFKTTNLSIINDIGHTFEGQCDVICTNCSIGFWYWEPQQIIRHISSL